MPWPKGRPRTPEQRAALRRGFDQMGAESRARMRRAGSDNGNWKGGKRLSGNGYVLVRVPGGRVCNGYELEHRLVMAEALGRPLAPDEIIHHIDGDKTNNDLSNLQIVTREEHQHIHLEGRGREPDGRFGRATGTVSSQPSS